MFSTWIGICQTIRLILKDISKILISQCHKKIVQFLSTVSSFLHIMIIHNIMFYKKEEKTMPLTLLHLNRILLLTMKMTIKHKGKCWIPLQCYANSGQMEVIKLYKRVTHPFCIFLNTISIRPKHALVHPCGRNMTKWFLQEDIYALFLKLCYLWSVTCKLSIGQKFEFQGS